MGRQFNKFFWISWNAWPQFLYSELNEESRRMYNFWSNWARERAHTSLTDLSIVSLKSKTACKLKSLRLIWHNYVVISSSLLRQGSFVKVHDHDFSAKKLQIYPEIKSTNHCINYRVIYAWILCRKTFWYHFPSIRRDVLFKAENWQLVLPTHSLAALKAWFIGYILRKICFYVLDRFPRELTAGFSEKWHKTNANVDLHFTVQI